MSDYFHNGLVVNIAWFNKRPLEDLEREISYYASRKPLALIIPALYSEFQSEALHKIVAELRKVPYIYKIVVSLDRADKSQFNHAKKVLSKLPQAVRIIWNDGPNMRQIYATLRKEKLFDGKQSKARGVWISLGYLLAEGRARAVALHDADIITYKRDLLARLVYPIMNPHLNYQFIKGYYPRFSDRLHGRVTRLFFTPLLRALKKIFGTIEYLEFLDSFRYPLAGEMAFDPSLTYYMRIPSGWGLEVGFLTEVYRSVPLNRIGQVDIASEYDHKHRDIGREREGLINMCVDIARTLFREMATNGFIFQQETAKTLLLTYLNEARIAIDRYEAVAALNGISYDRHHEMAAVEIFAGALLKAFETYMEDPYGARYIPNWSRVISAIPDIWERLYEAVEEDNC